MGFLKDTISPDDLRFEMDGVIRRLLSIEALLLEKERHEMGLVSDEDYKTWLRGRDQSLWGAIFKKTEEDK